jgi:hypothetical protein
LGQTSLLLSSVQRDSSEGVSEGEIEMGETRIADVIECEDCHKMNHPNNTITVKMAGKKVRWICDDCYWGNPKYKAKSR